MSLHFAQGADVFDVITVFVIVALFGSKVCPCPRFRFIMRFRVGARNDMVDGACVVVKTAALLSHVTYIKKNARKARV